MEEPEGLKELKSVLRSLVVSSPTQMDVCRLMRDYREMMGVQLPYSKFGYRDPLLFLRERCDDCFLFQGLPSNPTLILIVNDQIKHIDEFVRRQKTPSSSRVRRPKRASISENTISRSFRTRSESREAGGARARPPDPPPREHWDPPRESPHRPSPPRQPAARADPRPPPARSPAETNHQTLDKTSERIQTHEEEDGNYSRVVLTNFLRKRSPLYCSSQQLDDASGRDSDSGRVTTSSSSSSRRSLLEELKAELTLLVEERPPGVLCTDIVKLYRERFGRELELVRAGLTSVMSLVAAAPRLRVDPAGAGEWRAVLRDAAPAPPPARPAPAPRPLHAPAPAPPRAHVTPDDALPGIEYDADVFPADCMHFMESIPSLGVAGLRPDQMLSVNIGEVYSPSHFWLIRLGEEYNLAMEKMMDEMNQYYNRGEGSERVLALGAVQVGHYCASVYEGHWHRSMIVRALDNDTVKVRHVDYGTVERVPAERLRPLLRRWAALPAQAVRARLAGVRPGAGGRRWPTAAAAAFLNLVRNKDLWAIVVATDPEEDAVEVVLVDTTSADDVVIGAELVRLGHADPRVGAALGTAECYLLPRFEAIESAATPNYAEIHAYLRDGIALEYVDEFRQHVPAALPPLPPPPAAPAPPRPLPLLTRVPLLRGPPASSDKAVQMSPPPSPTPLDAPHLRGEPRTVSCYTIPTTSSNANHTTSSTLASRSPAADASGRSQSTVNLTPLVQAVKSMSISSSSSPTSSATPTAASPVTSALSPAAPVFSFAPASSAAAPAPSTAAPARPERPPPGTPPSPAAAAFSSQPPSFPPTAPAPHATPAASPVFCFGASPSPGGPAAASTPAHPAHPLYRPPPLRYLPPAHAPYPLIYPHPAGYLPGPPLYPPPPAYGGAGDAGGEARRFRTPGGGDVTLSVSECEIFRLLSRVDPHAAHWYMVDALSRAMGTRVVSAGPPPHSPRPLNPHAQEFRHPPLPPHHPRPPPGFEHRANW